MCTPLIQGLHRHCHGQGALQDAAGNSETKEWSPSGAYNLLEERHLFLRTTAEEQGKGRARTEMLPGATGRKECQKGKTIREKDSERVFIQVPRLPDFILEVFFFWYISTHRAVHHFNQTVFKILLQFFAVAFVHGFLLHRYFAGSGLLCSNGWETIPLSPCSGIRTNSSWFYQVSFTLGNKKQKSVMLKL